MPCVYNIYRPTTDSLFPLHQASLRTLTFQFQLPSTRKSRTSPFQYWCVHLKNFPGWMKIKHFKEQLIKLIKIMFFTNGTSLKLTLSCLYWCSCRKEFRIETNSSKTDLPDAFLQQTLNISTQAFLSSSLSAVIRYALLREWPTSNVCSGYLSGVPISFSSTSEIMFSKIL